MNEILEGFIVCINLIVKINISRLVINIVLVFMKDMVVVELGEFNGKFLLDMCYLWFISGIFILNGNLILVDFKNKKIKCFDNDDVLVLEIFLEY